MSGSIMCLYDVLTVVLFDSDGEREERDRRLVGIFEIFSAASAAATKSSSELSNKGSLVANIGTGLAKTGTGLAKTGTGFDTTGAAANATGGATDFEAGAAMEIMALHRTELNYYWVFSSIHNWDDQQFAYQSFGVMVI